MARRNTGAVGAPASIPGYETRVYGDPPQWADESDATYAIATSAVRYDVIRGEYFSFISALARIDPLGMTPTEAEADDGSHLHIRASATNSDGATGDNFVIGFSNNSLSGGYEIPATLTPDGAIREWDIPLSHAALTAWGSLLDDFASVYVGRQRGVGDTVGAAYAIRVYELWAVVPGGGRMPPLRQVQRPSVPRAVQNNSRQASLRSGRAFI